MDLGRRDFLKAVFGIFLSSVAHRAGSGSTSKPGSSVFVDFLSNVSGRILFSVAEEYFREHGVEVDDIQAKAEEFGVWLSNLTDEGIKQVAAQMRRNSQDIEPPTSG